MIVAANNGVFDASTTYYWRVKPYTPCATGNFSEAYTFTVDGILGVNDQSIEGLAMYPNPTKDVLNLFAI